MKHSSRLHVVASSQWRCASSFFEEAQWHFFSGGFAELRPLMARKIPENAQVIWIIPKQQASRKTIPSVMVDGRPIGLMFANNAEELKAQWSSNMTRKSNSRRAVLAQWDDDYLPMGRHWLRALGKNLNSRKSDWMANKIGGPRLCRRMAKGARLCVYFGHGHSDGLAGYHGLYIDDFLAEPFSGRVESFLSFSCLNLAQPNGKPCLGRELVSSGRVGAFWGAVGQVATDSNQELARLGIDSLLLPKVVNIGDWIKNMDKKIVAENNRSLSSAWQLYRLVGNPGVLI